MLTSKAIRNLCEVHSATHPGEFFYCLVDHAGMPGLHRKLLNAKADWISLFEGTKEAKAISVAPLLFQIGLDPDHVRHGGLLTWVGERGTYTSSLTILASPLPLRELAHRLTARLDAIISDGMEVLLRFYDPRVFEQLMMVLTADQKRALLNVGSCWWFLDRRGELQTVDAQFFDHDSQIFPLNLIAQQEVALIDASEPDQVAEQLHRNVPREFALIPMPERYSFLTRHIGAARRIGVDAVHELALYCALALIHGQQFATGPSWASSLDQIKSGDLRLTDVIRGMTQLEEIGDGP